MEKQVVWFDLETTGINIASDKIIEISMIKTDFLGNEIDSYYSLINPGNSVKSSDEAIEKHGITPEMLQDKPQFCQIVDEIISFIGDCDLGGYNIVNFDIPFIIEESLRCGKVFNWRDRSILDPLLIYNMTEKRDLTSAYKKYTGKDLIGAHRAENDVRATIEIFNAQKKLYSLPNTSHEVSDMFNELKRNNLDSAGKYKIVEIDDKKEIIFNFGKYSGKSVRSVYESDARYLDWIVDKGEFTIETKTVTKKILNRLRSENL